MPYLKDYATAADLKLRLGMDPSDTSMDTILGEVITAASRAVDDYAHRRFGQDDTLVNRTYWATSYLYLGIDDVSTATGFVLVAGGTTWALNTDYILGPRNIDLEGRPFSRAESLGRFFLPYPIGPLGVVTVTAKFGWPAVPTVVTEATLLQAARLFKRKDAAFGVLGSPDMGGGTTRLLARLDPDVEQLIRPYRRPRWRP